MSSWAKMFDGEAELAPSAMDEALGLAAWAAGYPVVVGNLNVSFRTMLPLHKVVTLESRVVSAEGRKVMVHGRLFGNEGPAYAEAQCLCITIARR